VSRAATSRLKVNPPLGMRPSLEFRRLRELQIDPSYQRTIEAAASQTLIRRIAMFWDWALCQPLAVAKRDDGALMVVDGQHRLAAARMRGDIDDLPCVVTAYGGAGDEAAAFVALNQQRRPLNKLDLFKAALAAEDNDARAIAEIMTMAGLRLAGHTNHTAWKPDMVANIAGIQDCYRSHGREVTLAALSALQRGFAGQVLRYAGTIFPGIYGFIAEERRIEGRVDLDRLFAALRTRSQKDWVAEIGLEAAASGNRRQMAARTVIRAAYTGRAVAPLRPVVAAAPKPNLTATGHKVWCTQCDRQVDAAQARVCPSQFCKAKVAA
jgi:hypothetical protein